MEHIEIATLASIAFFAALGHCVGMCGGIVLAYSASLPLSLKKNKDFVTKDFSAHKVQMPPIQDSIPLTKKHHIQSSLYRAFSPILYQLPFHLCYHCGKITTYCALGFIVGTLGYTATPNESIKYSILLVVGVLLVLYGFFMGQFTPRFHLIPRITLPPKFLAFIRSLLTQSTKWRLYVLGICNGLLPCGIVYYFLLTAAIAGNGLNGALVMGIFGIMTIPSLLFLGLFSTNISQRRELFLRLCGVGMIGLGLYEIYKASKALGIFSL